MGARPLSVSVIFFPVRIVYLFVSLHILFLEDNG